MNTTTKGDMSISAQLEAERDFFRDHPQRQFRLRAPMPTELAAYAAAIGLAAVPDSLARAAILVANSPAGPLWHPIYVPGIAGRAGALDKDEVLAPLWKSLSRGWLTAEDSSALRGHLAAAGIGR